MSARTAGSWTVGEATVGGFQILAPRVDGESDSRTMVIASSIQRDSHPVFGAGISWDEARANADLFAASASLLDAIFAIRLRASMAEADGANMRGALGNIVEQCDAALAAVGGAK